MATVSMMTEAVGASSSYLGDAELAGSQLHLRLLQLLGSLCLGALQLFAALDHRLHLWLHLTDVETGHSELFINETTALLLLRRQKNIVIRPQKMCLVLFFLSNIFFKMNVSLPYFCLWLTENHWITFASCINRKLKAKDIRVVATRAATSNNSH